ALTGVIDQDHDRVAGLAALRPHLDARGLEVRHQPVADGIGADARDEPRGAPLHGDGVRHIGGAAAAHLEDARGRVGAVGDRTGGPDDHVLDQVASDADDGGAGSTGSECGAGGAGAGRGAHYAADALIAAAMCAPTATLFAYAAMLVRMLSPP